MVALEASVGPDLLPLKVSLHLWFLFNAELQKYRIKNVQNYSIKKYRRRILNIYFLVKGALLLWFP